MNMWARAASLLKSIFLASAAFVVYRAGVEFYEIAWGTGSWWGAYSSKWGFAFILFVIFCVFCLFTLWFALWRNLETTSIIKSLIAFRARMGLTRFLVVIIIFLWPIWLLQYSPWGVVLSGPYIRLLIWIFTIFSMAFLLNSDHSQAWNWSGVLAAALLSEAGFALAISVLNVTDYPFSLGWSEGNRMWDYSLLFGKHLYNYSGETPPVAFLDIGRQLSGGLPFVLPHITILQERLWLGLMTVVPYIVLGWMAFQLPSHKGILFPALGGLWVWMFLRQGPIHTPLLWCAVLVALAWRRPIWLAVLLVMISSYFAFVSRSTWVFAPALWAGMLELNSVPFKNFRTDRQTWGRACVVVLAGLAGGFFSSRLISLGNVLVTFVRNNGISSGMPLISPGNITISSVADRVTNQPLLWYRLLPNATYQSGILLGLLIAVVPLISILVYLSASRIWVMHTWQKLAISLPLMAFLGVGLIASTKIGGGGDLHNMDMFLVGVMFAAAIAWRSGGAEWVGGMVAPPVPMMQIVMLMIAILGYQPLIYMQPISFAQDAEWIAKLTDAKTPAVPRSTQSEELISVLGSLPSEELINSTLDMVRTYVREAQVHGEVLFMDQRQLLTFGYIQNTILVPEYEKKLMMDKALSSDAAFFEPFYRDLAAHRFSLIISDPLRAPIKDSDYQFGEENNAWVKWIALPILCYYQPVETRKYVKVQLLIPADAITDCSAVLP